MAKILLVEDDNELRLMIATCLSFEHYTVESAENGDDAWARLKTYQYHLVILDWALPGMTGVEICKSFRRAGGTTAILMLTAKDKSGEKEEGLDSGADDYLTKPFDNKEFLARIRALLRRTSGRLTDTTLVYDQIVLEPNNFRVHRSGVDVPLVAKEFALLELFMRHPGRMFSVESLISHVWTDNENTSPESVRQHIKNLRRKLESVEDKPLIETVRGVGYRFGTTQ
jgi:DNA-binding response OmpR family regulator